MAMGKRHNTTFQSDAYVLGALLQNLFLTAEPAFISYIFDSPSRFMCLSKSASLVQACPFQQSGKPRLGRCLTDAAWASRSGVASVVSKNNWLVSWSANHPELASMLQRLCSLNAAARPLAHQARHFFDHYAHAPRETSRSPPPPQTPPSPSPPYYPLPPLQPGLSTFSAWLPAVSTRQPPPIPLRPFKWLPDVVGSSSGRSLHRSHGTGFMFIKFHKTGSTTLISALTREGCKHKLTMCNMLCNAKPLGSQRQDSCNAWGGDYATGAFRQGGKPLLLSIFPRATTFVTLLRHPVERLWSRYQNNLARGSTRSFDQLIAAEGHDYQLTLTHGNSTNLDLALLTLRQFDVVGITEDFDGFIVLFQLKMGWPMTSLVYQVSTHWALWAWDRSCNHQRPYVLVRSRDDSGRLGFSVCFVA